MHELSITPNVVKVVPEDTEMHRFNKMVSVNARIGELRDAVE